jgi:hypothetical protein
VLQVSVKPWTRQPQHPCAAAGTFAVINAVNRGKTAIPFQTRITDSGLSILSDNAYTVLADKESDVVPVGQSATILFQLNQIGNNATSALTNGITGGSTAEFNLYLDYAGTLYFRWGGETPGVTDLSFSSTHKEGVFLLSVGPAGMQVWLDGVLLGSNSATPSRSASTNALAIQDPTVHSYVVTTALYASFSQQFTHARNSELSRNPWQIFAPQRLTRPFADVVTLPTLSAPTYVSGSLTSSGWIPQVTAT